MSNTQTRKRSRSKSSDTLESTQEDMSNDVTSTVNPTDTTEQTMTVENTDDTSRPTMAIALPASFVDNVQSMELRTYIVGLVARALSIYQVDEVIVFDDSASTTAASSDTTKYSSKGHKGNTVEFMARVLQYAETPPYLRKALFPMHNDLRHAGLLCPLAIPHHMRQDEWFLYREGVVLDRPVSSKKASHGSLVDVGLNKSCRIDVELIPHVRVTIKMDNRTRPSNTKDLEIRNWRMPANTESEQSIQASEESTKKGPSLPTKVCLGKAVSPSEPRNKLGVYWGYNVRIASSFSQIFLRCPHKEGYDLTIAALDTAGTPANKPNLTLPKTKHTLIVFGGPLDLEEALLADEELTFAEGDVTSLFDVTLSTCPVGSSTSLRTEEAVYTVLSAITPKLQK